MKFSSRTTDLIHSPIGAAHSLLAHRVNDRPLLDLSQAAPAYPPAMVVQERIAAAAFEPSSARYAPQPGLPALRESFATDLSGAYAASVSADDVLITAGCNQAFCVTINALASPGDSVLLATPFYFNHEMWLKVEGIEPRHIANDQQLWPDLAHAEQLIDESTRAIVLVTPGNPTGITIPPERLHQFALLAERHDIALIIDETYRNFRPSHDPAHSLFPKSDPGETGRLGQDWQDTVVSLHSFSKDLAIPGYRIGAVVAGQAVRVEALKILDCVAISAPWIGQEAAITGLRSATDWRVEQSQRVAKLQERFENLMHSQPGGFELVSAGAYFGWVKAPPSTGATTAAIVRSLVVEHDILVIPGTAFTPTDELMLRFSFANLSGEQIDQLGERLNTWRNP